MQMHIIGTVRIVYGAGSMLRYGVRSSVCPSMVPQQQTRCCRFAAVGPAGRSYLSIAAGRTAAAAYGRRMRVVPCCQRTKEAEHRPVALVLVIALRQFDM